MYGRIVSGTYSILRPSSSLTRYIGREQQIAQYSVDVAKRTVSCRLDEAAYANRVGGLGVFNLTGPPGFAEAIYFGVDSLSRESPERKINLHVAPTRHAFSKEEIKNRKPNHGNVPTTPEEVHSSELQGRILGIDFFSKHIMSLPVGEDYSEKIDRYSPVVWASVLSRIVFKTRYCQLEAPLAFADTEICKLVNEERFEVGVTHS